MTPLTTSYPNLPGQLERIAEGWLAIMDVRARGKALCQNSTQQMSQDSRRLTRLSSQWRIRQVRRRRLGQHCQDLPVKGKYCSAKSQVWPQNLRRRVYLLKTRNPLQFLPNWAWKNKVRIRKKITWRERSRPFIFLAKNLRKRFRKSPSIQAHSEILTVLNLSPRSSNRRKLINNSRKEFLENLTSRAFNSRTLTDKTGQWQIGSHKIDY